METLEKLKFRRLTSDVGALYDGPTLDLAKPLAADEVKQIRQALLDHGVVFFRQQVMTDREMEAFAAQFGEPIPEPFVSARMPDAPPATTGDLMRTRHSTCVWHHDTSFVPAPPVFTVLRAVSPPAYGGDTCWSSMYAAYDTLSEPFRAMIDKLSAVHSIAPVFRRMGQAIASEHSANETVHEREHVHPLVLVHPETGRKALFYNEGWVSSIVGVTPAESEHIIALLREHCKSPNFAMRWHWEPNDLAIWDNRSVQHYAVPDYSSERIMQRVVTAGEVPVGPAD